MDIEKIWQSTLDDIQKEVTNGNFSSFFRTSQLLSIDDGVAKISVLSFLVAQILGQKFTGLINETLTRYAHIPVTSITFVTDSARKSRDKKAPVSQDLFTHEEKPIALEPIGHPPHVRSDFTFINMAVSSSNQLAYVASQTVAKSLGSSYNPLFMYGPTGVGKTHMMQAIANEVYHKDPSLKIIYTTSEEFTNQVVEAIRGNNTSNLRKHFRNANLLMIDDVQFIAGKDKVQEELFHTFNAIIDAGGQIVLSSDKPPAEIKKLESRLASRFEGGLTVDIEAPDFEMRTAILLKKAEKFGMELDIEIAKVIAEKEQNVRALEGALLRVMTQAQTTDMPVTVDLATKILANKKDLDAKSLHSDDIIDLVCQFYNVKQTQLKGPKRDASLVKARQAAMYLLKTELGITFVEIGNLLGGRDHTTIMHGVTKVENALKSSPQMHGEILGITKSLRG